MRARTLVRKQDTIPVRIMNSLDDSKTIYPDTVSRKLHAVDEALNLVSEGNKHLYVDRELLAHLKDANAQATLAMTITMMS